MKKFVALLLIAVLALSLASCKKKPKDDRPDVDISAFTAAIAATKPAKQTIDVVQKTAIDDLAGHYEITFNADGSATIAYSYEELNSLTSGATEVKSTKTGTVTRNANGSYTGTISGSGEAAASLKFDLASINKDCVVEDNTLSVKVAKDKTATVFGSEYPSDVDLVLNIKDGKVTTFSMTYTATAGQVSVSSKYE